MTWTFTLPLPPPSVRGINVTMGHHWRGPWAEKKAYLESAQGTLMIQRKQQQPILEPLTRVKARITVFTWNRFDDDNLGSVLKIPTDALVQAGILQDDARPHFQWDGVPEQIIQRARRRKRETDGQLVKRRMALVHVVEFVLTVGEE